MIEEWECLQDTVLELGFMVVAGALGPLISTATGD